MVAVAVIATTSADMPRMGAAAERAVVVVKAVAAVADLAQLQAVAKHMPLGKAVAATALQAIALGVIRKVMVLAAAAQVFAILDTGYKNEKNS
jgi:hypothetical protein